MAAAKSYHVSGHVLLRYGTAHLVDPLTAALRVQDELAASCEVTSEEEAWQLAGVSVRFHKGYVYRAGTQGIYVCLGDRAITYIDNQARFKARQVRGGPEAGRTASLKPRTRRKWHS